LEDGIRKLVEEDGSHISFQTFARMGNILWLVWVHKKKNHHEDFLPIHIHDIHPDPPLFVPLLAKV
jgi:hypothetical protein